jgi:hypothetical protein
MLEFGKESGTNGSDLGVDARIMSKQIKVNGEINFAP